MDQEKIKHAVSELLEAFGEDPQREGLKETPQRVAKMYAEIFASLNHQPEDFSNYKTFHVDDQPEMVLIQQIPFYSMCEHHILPFFGRVSIGYIPDGKIVGLSKLARIVNVFARRLQVQERLTGQICSEVMNVVGAKGVIVICNGEHLFMKMRGVEKQDSSTTTVDYAGVFSDDVRLREEFFANLKAM